MSIDRRDRDEGSRSAASQPLAFAAEANARAEMRLAVAIDDFFLPEAGRLDDRIREAIAHLLGDLVLMVGRAIRQHAARLLMARDQPVLAAALAAEDGSVLDRLIHAGLLRDREFMREIVARVRQDVIGAALSPEAPDRADTPSLLVRLAANPDGVVASSAGDLLAAESRRGTLSTALAGTRTDLPAELHHRLVWWATAALRERFLTAAGPALAILDRALAEAALRNLGAHDEGDRLEAAAMRLAAAFDATAEELQTMLVEAIGDRRLSLFIALLGHALGLDYADAREIALDPEGERLWLVLRALEIDRAGIAQIGLALCEADPRRDLEAFADALDEIAARPAERARELLAPMKLHPDYRAALLALARGRAA